MRESMAVEEQIVKPYHQTDRFSLYEGDCRSVLPIFTDCSFDSIVTDPPAGISFMGKDWDHHKGGRDQWVAWMTDVMRECLRVLKPGGHALVWAIPRTSHWTGCAIESAGFEVRDRVSHLFGSGFPKSLDISKQLDAMAGAERQTVGKYLHPDRGTPHGNFRTDNNRVAFGDFSMCDDRREITSPTSDAAKQWNGWGTALKPACEDWWLCRKPLEGTVAQNVLRHGTGGLNIDGCRIEPTGERADKVTANVERATQLGRWPSNCIHDGSEEVLAGFPETESGNGNRRPNGAGEFFKGIDPFSANFSGDSGSAARFFYCAKATQEDRNEGLEDLPHRVADETHKRPRTELDDPRRHGVTPRQNYHPTVKPTGLMRYLCRLITPPGGMVLDPFCGSGSTGKAAMLEGFKFVGIELDADYCQLALLRIEAVTRQGLLFA